MPLPQRQRHLIAQCAHYAHAAYDAEQFDDSFKVSDEGTDTAAYVFTVDRTLYVTGPGSQSARDWSLDFQIWRTKVDFLGGALVHAGFARAYGSIRGQLLEKAKQAKGVTQVVCCGHSLFGALATIAATDLAQELDVPVHCVTFGCPRVGDKKFAELFSSLVDVSVRCAIPTDPVTLAPTRWRFKHVRGLLAPDHPSPAPWYAPCRAIDHAMQTYVDATADKPAPEPTKAAEPTEPTEPTQA